MRTYCTACGAPAGLGAKVCHYCDTPQVQVEAMKPREEVVGRMCTYDLLENVILRGDMNTVKEAIDCTIVGNMNTLKKGTRVTVVGNMNTVRVAADCTIKGSMNTIRRTS